MNKELFIVVGIIGLITDLYLWIMYFKGYGRKIGPNISLLTNNWAISPKKATKSDRFSLLMLAIQCLIPVSFWGFALIYWGYK